MNEPLLRAHLLMDQERWEQAEGELRRVLTQDPNLAHAHALLALCLSRREQYDEATREARSAIGLAPDDWFAHYATAHVFCDRKRYEEARAAVVEAVRLNPHDAMPWGLLAMIEYSLKRWPDALAAAERGLAVDPEDSQCANARSMALVKLGRREEAAAALADTLAREPENAVTQANRGWTLLEQGDYRGAKECFREALRLQPGLDWARAGMVTALKARNPIYRWALNYFLWMSKLGAKIQWVLILGLFFGNQILRSVAAAVPAIAPYVWPISIAYVVFVLVSWLADPLFNLILRLDRFGRYVLSPDEIKGANLVGLCLLGAIVGLVAGSFLTTRAVFFAGLVSALLTIPCSAIFRCDKGWPRQMMAIYTAGMVFCGGVTLVALSLDIPILAVFGLPFFLGVFLSGFVANGLMSATVRS